jgi:hypothetical protein
MGAWSGNTARAIVSGALVGRSEGRGPVLTAGAPSLPGRCGLRPPGVGANGPRSRYPA